MYDIFVIINGLLFLYLPSDSIFYSCLIKFTLWNDVDYSLKKDQEIVEYSLALNSSVPFNDIKQAPIKNLNSKQNYALFLFGSGFLSNTKKPTQDFMENKLTNYSRIYFLLFSWCASI